MHCVCVHDFWGKEYKYYIGHALVPDALTLLRKEISTITKAAILKVSLRFKKKFYTRCMFNKTYNSSELFGINRCLNHAQIWCWYRSTIAWVISMWIVINVTSAVRVSVFTRRCITRGDSSVTRARNINHQQCSVTIHQVQVLACSLSHGRSKVLEIAHQDSLRCWKLLKLAAYPG